MTIPTRLQTNHSHIASATDHGEVLEVTLSDGSILWVPKNDANSDYAMVEAWAASGNSIGA